MDVQAEAVEAKKYANPIQVHKNGPLVFLGGDTMLARESYLMDRRR